MDMDFLERLVLDGIGSKYYVKAISPTLGAKQSIAVSPMPSNNYEHYFDGSYRQRYAFQILAKHEEQLTAYNTLNRIAKDLTEGALIPSQNGTYIMEDITISSDTTLVTQDEKYYIYGIQLSAALYIK